MTSGKRAFISEAEHTCMGTIADSCKVASSECVKMAGLRPDQSEAWMKAGAMFKVLEGQLFDLASQGLLTREKDTPFNA